MQPTAHLTLPSVRWWNCGSSALPPQIAPGHTLTAADVEKVRRLVERRNRQVRFLWENERHLREVIAKVETSPTFRLSRALSWPLRKLRDAVKGRP